MMNNMSKVRLMAAQGMLCAYLLASCQPYEPYTQEQVFKGAYNKNFTRMYGEINPSTNWDFSNKLPLREKETLTRGDADELAAIVDQNGYFEVDKNLFSEVTKRIKSKEITDKSFAFLIGENDYFDIFPVYLTSSTTGKISWALQMFVDNQNVINSTDPYYPGWKIGDNVKVRIESGGLYYKFTYNSACKEYGLISKPIIRYVNDGKKKLMHFSLFISRENLSIAKYAIYESQQSSLHYQMKILDVPKPSCIGENLNTLFVACDAADIDAPSPIPGGYRYQSLVFMIVGPRIPQVLYERKDNQGERWIDYCSSGKRYMIEDLGSASDFDFNDIVIDVEEISATPIVMNQVPSHTTLANLTTIGLGQTQEEQNLATLRFLCGTKPFRLTIGESTLGVVTDPTNQEQTRKQLLQEELGEEATYFEGPMKIEGWEPNIQVSIPDWNPSSNKVSVEVWPNGTSDFTEGGWIAQFPSTGEVPFMMALPTITQWSPEGIPFTGWQMYIPQ